MEKFESKTETKVLYHVFRAERAWRVIEDWLEKEEVKPAKSECIVAKQ